MIWRLHRGDEQFIAHDNAELQSFVRAGRLRLVDYLWNDVRQRWTYAEDMREIAGMLSTLRKTSIPVETDDRRDYLAPFVERRASLPSPASSSRI